MIKFKTKTEFPVPYKREIQQQIIRLIVNNITAEALYENLGGYPHLSVGVVFPLWGLLK